jgi:Na+-driven multidrug efflux pump
VLSQAVAAVVIVVLLLRIGLLRWERVPFATLLSSWRKIVTYAIPATLGSLLMPISNYVTTWTTASFGDAVVAAVAAGGKLEILAWMYPMSFGISIMPVISQNYGARLYSRVRRCFNFSVAVATVYLCFASAIIMTFPHKFVVFFSTEADVQSLMVTYMHIIPWGFVLLELTRYCGNALTGCGHPNWDAALKIFRMAGVLIPLSILTRHFHWLPGIFYSRLASDVLGGIASLIVTYYFLHKLPKQDGLIDRNQS